MFQKEPHDSWVIGDQKYISLHFLGAETYAKLDLIKPISSSF